MGNHADIRFDFEEHVPLLRAIVNGTVLRRVLLDTAAPRSFLSKDTAAAIGLSPDDSDTVRVDSFRVGTAEFGPLDMTVRDFGPNRLDGLLGTREIRPYCLLLDFVRCALSFESQPVSASARFSRLEIFRGRPLIHVEHMTQLLRFVLDTGSSASWLFKRGQDKLRDMGEVTAQHEEAKAAHSTLDVSESMIVENMSIGGAKHDATTFLLAKPHHFGDNPPEDGILGTDVMDDAVAIIELRAGRFALRT